MIKTEKLNTWFGNNHVLKDITMDIEKKRVTAIMGPSGCGKSTLIKTFNRMNEIIDEFRVEGNLVFVKAIIKKEKVQKLNRASAHKIVEGNVGNCAGKTYCCTFEWSKDMFQEGPLSKNQYMHMETNFKAKIHVYR